MTNPFVSNCYQVPVFSIDEPQSFESLSYTSPAPAVVTVFRSPMQAPQFEWWRPDYSWQQGPSLSMLATHVILREPLQAPYWNEWADWRPAWNPVNLTLLHATVHAAGGHRPIGSEFAGRPDKIIGSHIARRYQ